jgi:hypothetical protein
MLYPGKRQGGNSDNEPAARKGRKQMEMQKSSDREAKMNKGRLIGGIILVAVAALLTVLYFTLPEGDVAFMMGDTNAIYVPVFVLGGLGLWMLATVRKR